MEKIKAQARDFRRETDDKDKTQMSGPGRPKQEREKKSASIEQRKTRTHSIFFKHEGRGKNREQANRLALHRHLVVKETEIYKHPNTKIRHFLQFTQFVEKILIKVQAGRFRRETVPKDKTQMIGVGKPEQGSEEKNCLIEKRKNKSHSTFLKYERRGKNGEQANSTVPHCHLVARET